MNTVSNPSYIKIGILPKEYNEREDSYNELIMIYSPFNDFLGSAYLSKLGDSNTFVINTPVARKGFGKVLIEASLMHVTNKGGMLASVRDGKNKSGIYDQLERIYKGEYGGSKFKLPKIQNQEMSFTSEDEEPHLFFGYKVKPSKSFAASCVDKDIDKEKKSLLSLDKIHEETFFISYQENDTSWIDEEYPLNKAYKNAYFKSVEKDDSIEY
jgi:hypothetical protein